MLTATLGGLIKDYRIKKRLSQQTIALRIGWSDTTRLSKIEQGRVSKPTRETLDKVMKALDLSEQEKGQMLLASKILPTQQEFQRVVNRLKPVISNYRYPLILVDFAWYVAFFNAGAQELFELTSQEIREIEKKKPHWFEVFFNRKKFKAVEIKGGTNEKAILGFAEHEIALFKYEQSLNTNESWFLNLLSKMSKNAYFSDLWRRIKAYQQEHLLYEYEVNTFKGIYRGQERNLSFHVTSIHPTFDFRFYLLMHFPADEVTTKFYSGKL